MQDVNNDMDDLFRKAAEHYPLKTEGADWQKIAAGLQDAAVPVAEEKEKRKRRLLWLLLLLPLALLCGIYHNGFAPAKIIADTKKDANIILSNKNKQPSALNSTDSSFDTAYSIEKKTSEPPGEITSAGTGAEADHQNAFDSNRRKENTGAGSTSGSALSHPVNKETGTGYPEGERAVAIKNNDEESAKKNESSLQPFNSTNRIDKTEEIADLKKEKTSTALQATDDSLVVNDTKRSSNDVKKDSAANDYPAAENKSNHIKTKPRVQTGFYAGLLASFDISTVKLQRINKTGYGFELLLGYRFSKRVSVESGIDWTKKNYYSIGKYFDKTRTTIPAESKIIYTNGSCAMYEIPAVVKYDFAQRKKSNWFATAGLSSYIMKDESYTYYANHTGNYYTATKKYSNSGSNLFSVASFSIGYQLQLNKHLSLRAEPYIKMPLSGIGIAKMPITSAGITAGFTRSF